MSRVNILSAYKYANGNFAHDGHVLRSKVLIRLYAETF